MADIYAALWEAAALADTFAEPTGGVMVRLSPSGFSIDAKRTVRLVTERRERFVRRESFGANPTALLDEIRLLGRWTRGL